jgi:GNAT superfamily N-acetyltransferase
VQPARPVDFARIAQLTVDVHVEGGLASGDYAPELADVAGRASRAELLVALDAGGAVVGSVALVVAGGSGNVTTSDEEAACRMIVVDPAVQGRGIGRLRTGPLRRALQSSTGPPVQRFSRRRRWR